MDRPDLAWKRLLQYRLPAVLARLFPDVHALIDWQQEYYLPDKHLLPMAADSRTGMRVPDFVALVRLLDACPACIHVEIQCTRQAGFADRIALYHARLRDRFAMPVFNLVILGDSSPTWRPHTATDLHSGCGTTFHFRIAELLDFHVQHDALLEAREPVPLAIAAHLIALATRRHPERRCRAKLGLSRSLHERHCNLRELNELQSVIDWMLPLPAEWQRRLAMHIDEFILAHEKEDKNSLNYLIPELVLQRHMKQAEVEGKAKGMAEGKAEGKAEGRAEGRARGLLEGQRQTLKLQLAVRFGQLPAKLLHVLERADGRQLERLAIALVDSDTLDGALHAAGLRT